MWQTLANWISPTRQLPKKYAGIPWSDLHFLAIDLELTSLDPMQADILSIGWVEGQASMIDLCSCYYKVIKSTSSLHQSPVIHGLLGEDVANGEPVKESLHTLLEYATSHIWVFHNTDLDMAVLRKVYAKLALPLPLIVTLDTLRLALYQLYKQQNVLAPNAATLTSCRQRFNLPQAPAHNALDDAQATLELLFAQMNQFDPTGKAPLSQLVHTKGIKVFQPTED